MRDPSTVMLVLALVCWFFAGIAGVWPSEYPRASPSLVAVGLFFFGLYVLFGGRP